MCLSDWLQIIRPDPALDALVQKTGAVRVRRRLLGLAMRSIRIKTQPVVGSHRPGASRLGGLPDLPAGVKWPRRKGVDSPLAFLAQINLEEAAPYDPLGRLPKQGILYFFADPEEPYGFEPADSDRWQVIFSKTVPSSGPTPAPDDLNEAFLFKEAAVSFATEWTLPPWESPEVEKLALTDQEAEDYLEATSDDCVHRLLGHPQQIQGCLQEEVALAAEGLLNKEDTPEGQAAIEDCVDWVLLLQLDSDDSLGMMWGDKGRLYFYIHVEDLMMRQFDKVWLTMQCY